MVSYLTPETRSPCWKGSGEGRGRIDGLGQQQDILGCIPLTFINQIQTFVNYNGLIFAAKTLTLRLLPMTKMTLFSLALVLIILFSVTGCEKKDELVNKTTDAQVIGFVTEKCFCCWGWVIKVGADTIKTEQIPTLTPTENIVFPINARITIGERAIDCSGRMADYYEIKEFTEIKLSTH